MERVLVAAVLVAVAVVAALVIQRRRPAPPTQSRHWDVPAQLDRADFAGADRPWLVAVFTSSTCDSCERATAKAEVLASALVAYEEIPYQSRKDVHERYGIEVVPLKVIFGSETFRDRVDMTDAEFFAEATRAGLEIDPASPAEVDELLKRLAAYPPEIFRKAQDAIGH